MRTMDDDKHSGEILSIWQILLWQAKNHNETPKKLSRRTEKSEQAIVSGFKGEPIEIDLKFLNDYVSALGLVSGRTKDKSGNLTWEECIELLKPPSEMPPKQSYFWEDDNFDDE